MSERINITPNESGTYEKAMTVNGITFDVKWVPRKNEKGEIQNYEASTSSTFNEYNVPKDFYSLKSPDKDLAIKDLKEKIKGFMDEHDIRK